MESTSSTIANCRRAAPAARPTLHVVAQVVEAELRRRAVDHVAAVHPPLLVLVLHVLRVDRADGQPERVEEREGPVAVALHQVVVHGHHVHLQALDARHVARQRADDRLALARLHLGDLALQSTMPPMSCTSNGRARKGGRLSG
jgi:hypothetical protein